MKWFFVRGPYSSDGSEVGLRPPCELLAFMAAHEDGMLMVESTSTAPIVLGDLRYDHRLSLDSAMQHVVQRSRCIGK